MSIEKQRKQRAKWRAAKEKRMQQSNVYNHEEMAILKSLTHDEKVKLIDIVNEVGRQWKWQFPKDCMVEMPNPGGDKYTIELLEMDMLFIGRALKDLDFDGWLFAILVEKGGTKWAATIFSRLGKDANGRRWARWQMNPEFLAAFDKEYGYNG